MTEYSTLLSAAGEVCNKSSDERYMRNKRKLHIEKLQKEHAATIEIVNNARELQNIIDKFDDSRVHWVEWEDYIVEGDPAYAKCGAMVHDGDHWRSSVAQDSLAHVNCEDCTSLPDFNMKLLSETDVGDDDSMKVTKAKDLADLAVRKGSLDKAVKTFKAQLAIDDALSKND